VAATARDGEVAVDSRVFMRKTQKIRERPGKQAWKGVGQAGQTGRNGSSNEKQRKKPRK
jgi:hypothetical protein